MPSIKTALTQCAVVSPADPLLWLSQKFLNMSPSGQLYELRKKSAVLRTFTTPAASCCALLSTADVVLTLEDHLAVTDATCSAKALIETTFFRSTHPTLKPLSSWQKRMQRVTGKSVQTSTQTGGDGSGIDVATQLRPTTTESTTQTTLTGTKVLETLGQEMTLYKKRAQELKSEEQSIHEVFQRVYFESTGLNARLLAFWNTMDVHQVGCLDRATLLQGLINHPDARKNIPGLSNLFRPKRWQQTFDEIVQHTTTTTTTTTTSSTQTITLVGIQQWLTHNTATISRSDFIKALNADPILNTILRWSECLHPLLRPRKYHHLFNQIIHSDSSSSSRPAPQSVDPSRMNERQLIAYIQQCRVGSAEDVHAETVSSLFHLMAEKEDGKIGKYHLLRIVTGADTSLEAEEVRAVLHFSVSLRPLLTPRMWSHSFDNIDQDEDGLLSYDEFTEFIHAFTSQDGDVVKKEEEKKQQQMEMQIAHELTQDTMQQVKRLFDYVDTPPGSGTLAKRDLLHVVLDDNVYREMLRNTPPLRPLLYPGQW